MPELPEVETMRRGILSSVGCRVKTVALEPCACRPLTIFPAIGELQRRVKGQKILAVDRLGKRVVLRLQSSDALIFEPRMTGLVLVADPPDVEHLRFRLDLTGGSLRSIWFWDRRGLGSIRLLSAEQIEQQLGRDKLGIDALAISAKELQAALGDSRRAIKVALLDQRAVAGVGNLYASEVLHRAKVHPAVSCDALTWSQWRKIHLQLLAVLEEAIRHEGSTLSDGTYRNALNQSGGYQNCHLVYDRAGEPCRSCRRGTIIRVVQAQRSTFLCERCQQALGD
jgi:formamidopyrimidine-DNA glycosylase